MSRSDDRDDLEDRLAELESTLRDLQSRLDRPSRRFRPPTPGELLRFTEEYTIPTVIAVLEANVRALELLQRVLRLADPVRAADAESTAARRRADDLRRDAADGLSDALSELRTALSEADRAVSSASRIFYSAMDKFVIRGGTRLRGELPVSGSKNTALPLMAAAVLADGESTITNVPNLRDVITMANVLRVSGATVNFDSKSHTARIDASRVSFPESPYDLVKKMRASFYMLGALLGRCGSARVSLPGGCAWGPRPVNLHVDGIKALGADIDLEQGYVVAKAKNGRLEGGVFELQPSSVGATINIMLAAVRAKGSSRIDNAAREPDVVVFGEALQAMGAHIEGLGTATLEIEGVETLKPIEFRNAPDRIELGTFMILAAIAGAHDDIFHISNADATHLGDAFIDAFARTGTPFSMGPDYVDIIAPEELKAVSIETGVYPGFPTDLQAQWTVLLTQAAGNGRIVDNVYYDRFAHIGELHRMGVNAIVVGNEVAVQGAKKIMGAEVMSTDLRGSVSLVMAGVVAEGETHVQRIYHLDRGYEDLEGKLRAVGADVRRDEYEELPEQEVKMMV